MFRISVRHQDNQSFSDTFDTAAELGRQRTEQEPMCVKLRDEQRWRVAIARIDEVSVSRNHVRLELVKPDVVQVTNVSLRSAVYINQSDFLGASQSRQSFMPFDLTVGDRAVRVESIVAAVEAPYHRLAECTIAPSDAARRALRSVRPRPEAIPDKEWELVAEWLQTVTNVLQSATNSTDFFESAAQAVVDLAGLDSGAILSREQGSWKIVALKRRPGLMSRDDDWRPSRQILDLIDKEKRTVWQSPEGREFDYSLRDIEAVVAAPILNSRGEIIAALYGDRRQSPRADLPQISRADAILVETLATSVALGLARLEQEKAAVAAEVRFEQFFSPELSRQLAAEPDLLRGRDTEVSILFCDIRGFSTVTEKLGPAGTVDWISDVLGMLSDCVIARGGVLVDYIGDELMAMWGAPTPQQNHAELACQAALDMLGHLPALNGRWQSLLGVSTQIGVGINTGMARVGNVGTPRKFKYGPLGNTVNVASRVQGATKFLKTEVTITGSTRTRLPPRFAARQLCKARVVNIKQPIELYELTPHDSEAWRSLCGRYEQALTSFEKRDFRQTTKILGDLLSVFPDDGPSLVVLSRAVNYLVNPPKEFAPGWEVWEPPGK